MHAQRNEKLEFYEIHIVFTREYWYEQDHFKSILFVGLFLFDIQETSE